MLLLCSGSSRAQHAMSLLGIAGGGGNGRVHRRNKGAHIDLCLEIAVLRRLRVAALVLRDAHGLQEGRCQQPRPHCLCQEASADQSSKYPASFVDSSLCSSEQPYARFIMGAFCTCRAMWFQYGMLRLHTAKCISPRQPQHFIWP